MKRLLLLVLLLTATMAQAKDEPFTPEQTQALHQEAISQFKSDFQNVLNNYNDYVDHSQDEIGLKSCMSNLNIQLKQNFNHYQWDSYKMVDLGKIPLKIQSQIKTLFDLSKDEKGFNYYSYGKIFVIESKNEDLLNQIAPQIATYLPNTQLVKDQNFSNHTYLIKYVMLKSMSASEYSQMVSLVNQQTTVAMLCTSQYLNHSDNELYTKFVSSFNAFSKRYSIAFNDLLNSHDLDDNVALHINDDTIYFGGDDGLEVKVYKSDNGYIAKLTYYQAIMFMARSVRYAKTMEEKIYYTQQQIIDRSKQAKNEIDALF